MSDVKNKKQKTNTCLMIKEHTVKAFFLEKH